MIALLRHENGGRGGEPLDHRAYLLQELRCAVLRARLWQADIEAVGLALKGGLIDPEQALELLADCEALHLILPAENGMKETARS